MKKQLAIATAILLVITICAITTNFAKGQTTNPTITTDKADYSPEEVVQISGTSFAEGDYSIAVQRPDGSIVKGDGTFTNGWDTISVGTTGEFVFKYQLDGILGTYTVRVYSLSWSGIWTDDYIATTTFTDAHSLKSTCTTTTLHIDCDS